MTIYHMETEAVRGMANRLQSTVEEMQSQLQSVSGSVESLDWISTSRDQFVSEMASLIRSILNGLNSGLAITQRVEREVLEWEEITAQLGEGAFVSPTIVAPNSGDGSSPVPISCSNTHPIPCYLIY